MTTKATITAKHETPLYTRYVIRADKEGTKQLTDLLVDAKIHKKSTEILTQVNHEVHEGRMQAVTYNILLVFR